VEPTQDKLRLTGRAVGEYILRWAESVGPYFEGDLVRAMIYTAILQANVREIWNDPALNQQYGEGQAPPDALRRPISVSSVAASLNLPRETVRRHVIKMIEVGQVVKKDAGVIVPLVIVQSAGAEANLKVQYANVRRLVLALRKAGVSFAEDEG
jgi:transposase-like protein